MRALLALLGLTALAAPQTAAQGIVVAPHAVYVDHSTRSASITLYNPGGRSVEVTISSVFGYPITDSAGQLALFTPDSLDPSMPSAAEWIEAFPKRMVIQPLQRQTVRLLARPPQGLPEGEYWSRVIISAKEAAPSATAADSERVSIGFSLEVRTIIPLTYRKGALKTGLSATDLQAKPEGDSLVVRAKLTRQGSAAYIGTVKGTLLNPSGKAVASFEEPIAVYYDVDPVFSFSTRELPSGRYRLRLEYLSERPDISPDLLLRAPPVRDSVEVELP